MSALETRKVLVADRESVFVADVREALGDPYELIVASSRKESLEKAKTGSPHLVIIGFLEPRGDSFRLHEELRECLMTRNIPQLIVDVSPEEHSRKGWRRYEGMRMNAEGYLSRPFEPAELREEVKRALESAAAVTSDSREVLEQMDLVLRRVERIEKALGSQVPDRRGSRAGAYIPAAQLAP